MAQATPPPERSEKAPPPPPPPPPRPRGGAGAGIAYTIRVKNRDYAVGLFWQVATSMAPAQIQREAVLFAQKLAQPHKYVCVKPFGIKQYGLGASKHHYNPKSISAAATAAENVPATRSFLGVWKIKGGFWLCALRAGAIHPNGDKIFVNEEAARQAFLHNLELDEWNQIIAPASWGIDSADEISLESFFRKPGTGRVIVIGDSNRRIMAMAASALLLLGGGYFAFNYTSAADGWFRGIDTSVLEELPVPTPVRKKVEFEEVQSWRYIPVNSRTHNQCMHSVRDFYKQIPGWSVSTIECDAVEGVFTSTWSRYSGGTARMFDQYSRHYRSNGSMPYDERSFGGSGQSAVLTRQWRIDEEENIAASEPQLSLEEAEVHLWTLQQSTGIDLNIRRDSVDPRIVYPPRGYTVLNGRGLRFTLSTNLDPAKMFRNLYKIPGSVIYKITYQKERNLWRVEGFIHQKEEGGKTEES